MKKNTKLNFLLIFLLISLVSSLYLGINHNKKLLSHNFDDYNSWNSQHNNLIEKEEITEKTNLYSKILSKSNINTLIIGDEVSIGNMDSSDNTTLDKSFNNMLKKKYSIKSNFLYSQKAKENISDGNILFDNDNSLINYDLAIISFGTNDSLVNTPIDTFAQDYTNLIYKIKSRNYKCTILVLLPPTLADDNIYLSKIKYICTNSNIDYVENYNDFYHSKHAMSDLIIDNTPTALGYEIIINNIFNTISKNIY